MWLTSPKQLSRAPDLFPWHHVVCLSWAPKNELLLSVGVWMSWRTQRRLWRQLTWSAARPPCLTLSCRSRSPPSSNASSEHLYSRHNPTGVFTNVAIYTFSKGILGRFSCWIFCTKVPDSVPGCPALGGAHSVWSHLLWRGCWVLPSLPCSTGRGIFCCRPICCIAGNLAGIKFGSITDPKYLISAY